MPKACLDTDILSEILKGRDPYVVENAERYLADHPLLSFTSVTRHEIIFGLEFKAAWRQLARAQVLLDTNDLLPCLTQDFDEAGRMRGRARRLGADLAFGDSLIAAVVHRLGYPLVTGNTRHFLPVIEAGWPLVLLNWREPNAPG